ncbi:MAG: hypothetical protein VKQ33_01010 [Candidatus Sericytochromatia bacterium]|nr:hypothetical protein [Candidatus Sericytochromatia bacterium]
MPLVAAQRLLAPLVRREASHEPPSAASLSPEEAITRAEALAIAALDAPETAPEHRLPGWLGLRDAEEAAWSVLGALECGRLAFAGRVLERVMGCQLPDGRLPATPRAGAGRPSRWLGWLGRGRGTARPGDEAARSVLATAMVAWACAEFAVRTQDFEFCRRWRTALDAAVTWLDTQERPGVGQVAAYHQAQMALGQLAIASGDAVEGARRWAAAAAARGQLQRALARPEATEAERLLALGVTEARGREARETLARCDQPADAGLRAWAATGLGEASLAREALEQAGRKALEAGVFSSRTEAGQFVRGLSAYRRLAASLPAERPERTPRGRTLSEDEVRILAAC